MNATADSNPSVRGPPTRRVFETSDLDLGRKFLSAAYGSDLHLTGREHDQFIRHIRYDCGSFALDDLTLGMDATFDVGPLDNLAVFQVVTGWMEHEWGGSTRRTGPGDTAANPPPHQPYTVHVHNTEYCSVNLSRSLLKRTAGFTEDQPGSAVHFTGMEPASAGLADHWRSAVAHVRSLIETRPGAMNEPLVSGNIARSLAQSALITFPNTGGPQPTSADGGDATPGAVRKAIAFMDENADNDIGLADMAAAARISPPALQIAFARHHTTTPLGTLRGVRLDRAHFDLLAVGRGEGVHDGATVEDIGARWGFSTPADFATSYRHVYGVSPHEVLTT